MVLLATLAVATRAMQVHAQPEPADVRPVGARPSHHWRDFAAGALTSLFAHEMAHVVTAVIVGGQPTLGFDKWRPTVYSGIDVEHEPRKQFLFSSMGLNVQAARDEAILDVRSVAVT